MQNSNTPDTKLTADPDLEVSQEARSRTGSTCYSVVKRKFTGPGLVASSFGLVYKIRAGLGEGGGGGGGGELPGALRPQIQQLITRSQQRRLDISPYCRATYEEVYGKREDLNYAFHWQFLKSECDFFFLALQGPGGGGWEGI